MYLSIVLIVFLNNYLIVARSLDLVSRWVTRFWGHRVSDEFHVCGSLHIDS